MHLPVRIGYVAATLTLMVIVWSAFLRNLEVLNPSFIYKALLASWFSGIAFYGWSGYALISYYKSLNVWRLKELEEAVVEPMEIPLAEIKRIAGSEKVKQLEEEEEQV